VLLRTHLERIGLHKERPELFKTTNERHQVRVHDLRASFVTIKLANDWTETQVQDRTGHTSSIMINRYRRLKRHFEELAIGDFAPLNEALPELALTQYQMPAALTDNVINTVNHGSQTNDHPLTIGAQSMATFASFF
jgi:hypothetical protein